MFTIVLVVLLFSGSVRSWIVTDINKDLMAKSMNVTLHPALAALDSESFNFLLIFPGTKWCGPGNTAQNYDDLGTEGETDICCRVHDNCPDFISGGETKHGLTNRAFYTRLTCDCDEQFRTCLQNVDRPSATIIREFYFNVLGTQCFNNTYPSQCAKRCINTKCGRYTYDTSGELKYEWFDITKC